jgi:hypothetical protein
MSIDTIDDLGIDREDRSIQPSGMTLERAMAIAQGALAANELTSVEHIERVLPQYNADGLTDSEVATKLGVKRQMVRNVRLRLRLPLNREASFTDWTAPDMLKIAEKLDLDRTWLEKALKKTRGRKTVAQKRAEQRRRRIAAGGRG